MIKKLSLENTEILRSQIDIPSVRHTVVELILNSIDAKAMSISVTVHKLSVSVSDDGNGFDPQDLKLLKRNCIVLN
jgi:DNA mismatch repair ATPase MutL